MNIVRLAEEIRTDPLSRGYASMTDAQVVDSLNTLNRPVTSSVVPTYKLIEATAPADFAALSAGEKLRYQVIISAGTVDISGTNIRNAFFAMFPVGSVTRTNLVALQTTSVSRAFELGLGEVVELRHVQGNRP